MQENRHTFKISKIYGEKSARKLNHFPNMHKVSKHCSPRMILCKENLVFKTHYVHYVGDLAQAHEDKIIKNGNSLKVLDCIYLNLSADL